MYEAKKHALDENDQMVEPAWEGTRYHEYSHLFPAKSWRPQLPEFKFITFFNAQSSNFNGLSIPGTLGPKVFEIQFSFLANWVCQVG
jgi:hypothetical protein